MGRQNRGPCWRATESAIRIELPDSSPLRVVSWFIRLARNYASDGPSVRRPRQLEHAAGEGASNAKRADVHEALPSPDPRHESGERDATRNDRPGPDGIEHGEAAG